MKNQNKEIKPTNNYFKEETGEELMNSKIRKNRFLHAFEFMALLACGVLFWPIQALPMPTGGSVVAGNVTIAQPSQTTMDITQTTQKGIINWNGFSINVNELVQFLMPGSSAVILNRVVGGNPSVILGQMSANGQVFVINNAGILVGAGAKIDVGSFLATTLNISDSDFLAGNYNFSQDPAKALSYIVNKGTITVSPEGYIILVAPLVSNEGLLVANMGTVDLGATQKFTVNFEGNNLINFAIDKLPEAPGSVLISQDAASDIIKSAVNTSGLIQAGQVIDQGNGVIELVGASGLLINAGTIQANGSAGNNAGSIKLDSATATGLTTGSVLEAKGIGNNSNGGLIETSSQGSMLINGNIDASAQNGTAGTWLLDPTNVTINSGGYIALDGGPTWGQGNITGWIGNNAILTNGDITHYLNGGTNVVVSTVSAFFASGDITLNALIDNSGGSTVSLTFDAENNIILHNNITSSSGTLNVNLAAGYNTGTGSIIADAGTQILTNGGSLIASAGTTSGNITLGGTGNGGLDAVWTNGGGIQLTASAGSVNSYGSLETSSAVANGGDILITGLTADIGTNGHDIINSSSNVNAGTITINLNGTGASFLGPVIAYGANSGSNGGDIAITGSGIDLTLSGANAESNGGTPGTISVKVGNLTLAGDVKNGGSTSAEAITLEAGTGSISQTGGTVGTGTEYLILSAATGIDLGNVGGLDVAEINAYNSTSGDINLNNTSSAALTLDNFGGLITPSVGRYSTHYAIENTAEGGNVTIHNNGDIDIPGTNGFGVYADGNIELLTTALSGGNINMGGNPLGIIGAESDEGSINIQADGSVYVGTGGNYADIFVDSGPGTLKITSNGGDVTIDGNSYIESDTGDITVTSADNINLAATSLILNLSHITSYTGNIYLYADSGNITTTSGYGVIATDTGTITLEATGNISLGALSAGGLVTVIADSGQVGTGAISSNGNPLNSSGDPTVNIAGASALLYAATGIGSSGTHLTTAVSELQAINSGGASGDIYIDNTGALELVDLGGYSGTGVGYSVYNDTGGDIVIENLPGGSSILVSNDIYSFGGNIVLTADGPDGYIEVNATINSDAPSGDVTLTANGVNGSGQSIIMDPGSSIVSGHDVFLNANVTGTGDIVVESVTATHNINIDASNAGSILETDDNAVLSAGNAVTLSAYNSIGSNTGSGTIPAGWLDIDMSSPPSLSITTTTGDVYLNLISSPVGGIYSSVFSTLSVGGSNIGIGVTGADFTFNNNLFTGLSQNLTFIADDIIFDYHGTAINTSGNVTLNAENGDIDNIDWDNGVANIIGDTIDMTAISGGIGAITNPIQVTASTLVNADTSADGSDININGVGDLPLGLINAGTGDVVLVSSGNILNDISPLNVIANNLTLDAATRNWRRWNNRKSDTDSG